MIEILNKKNCTGCSACANACPKSCISMREDDEGFNYPDIDKSICVNCRLCESVCPMLNTKEMSRTVRSYACINKDEQERYNSSSGGVFSLLSEYILDKGGVVFGAAFDNEFVVRHIPISKKEDIFKLRGSKYVQSKIDDCYRLAEEYLKQDVIVLFSGTPCQISGLKRYLGREYEGLLTVDIACHGVPSELAWRKYTEYLTDKYRATIKGIPSFRSKVTGWYNYSVKIGFNNNKKYQKYNYEDVYMKAFVNGLSVRPSCFDCKFKGINRESDLTLADFWGIDKIRPELFDEKGTSLVMVHSAKGDKLIKLISNITTMCEIDTDEAVKYNPAITESLKPSKDRSSFIQELQNKRFDKAVNSFIPRNRVLEAKIFTSRLIKKAAYKINIDY